MNKQLDFAWHETAEDATQAAIHKSGKNLKTLAIELWPHLKMETAYSSIRAALNPDQPRKLTFDEHLRIASLTGQFDVLYYASQELHHSRPEPVQPEDEKERLQQEFIKSAAELQKLAARIGGIAA